MFWFKSVSRITSSAIRVFIYFREMVPTFIGNFLNKQMIGNSTMVQRFKNSEGY